MVELVVGATTDGVTGVLGAGGSVITGLGRDSVVKALTLLQGLKVSALMALTFQ